MDGLGSLLARLRRETNARAVLMAGDTADVLACDLEPGLSLEAVQQMSSFHLGGLRTLARHVGEPDFGVLFHDVPGEDVCVSVLDDQYALVVVFDQNVTSLGAVRSRLAATRTEFMQFLGPDPAA